jgi:large subunit ribosomal protein L32
MGALPKHKISHMRQGKRRAVINLSTRQTIVCPSCGKPKLPHQACPHCGTYRQIQKT